MAPKRICLFSDGSGNTPEMNTLTNIVNLAKAIRPIASDEKFQQVFYDPGVGTGRNDYISGFYFGAGLDTNMKQLYTELALNYVPGDEVYIFGFSRGAYTARSLAGMIHTAGLVRRDGLDWVEEAYEMYKNGCKPESSVAKMFRMEHGDRIPIKALVVFDTVGAMGFPLPLPWPLSKWEQEKYAFHDMTLYPEVEHALHAMSIDESRKKFMVTMMEPADGREESQLTQLFFAGHHSGVGGGDSEEKPLADMACKFIVDELRERGCGLDIDEEQIGGEYFDVPPKTDFPFMDKVIRFLTGVEYRPVTLETMHHTAIRRYCRVPAWRPKALENIHEAILLRGKELGYEIVRG